MYISYTFNAHSMHIQCTFKVYAGSMFKLELDENDGDIAYGEGRSMYMQCALNVHFIYIQCTFNAHSMYI